MTIFSDNMQSHVIEEFEREYNDGEFQELSRCAIPFIRDHWLDLRLFIERFNPLLGDERLDTIIKLFILHHNMPFDMGLYMKSQKRFIEKTVMLAEQTSNPDQRREAVAQWIRENAQKHRHEAILKQVLCFDKVKDQILPLVRDALDHGDRSALFRSERP
jgi:hypothetical protein